MSEDIKKFEWLPVVRGGFAFLSCLLIFISKTNSDTDIPEFLNLTTNSLFLIGIFFSILFLVSSLEKMLAPITELFLTKVVIVLSITGVMVISNAEASSLLNSVFYVDASLFPFSRTFLTGIFFLGLY